MLITASAYAQICETLGTFPPECGGILGQRNGIITDFCFDRKGDSLSYSPDCEFLNAQIEKWASDGIEFAGIAHSHPFGQELLSAEDIRYIKRILQSNNREENNRTLYFPVVIPESVENRFKIIGYEATADDNGRFTVESTDIMLQTEEMKT